MGNFLDGFLEELQKGTEQLGGKDDAKRRAAALLLIFAGRPADSGHFLPTTAEAEKAKDIKALNMIGRYFVALHRKERKKEHLESAWEATQAALTLRESKDEDKEAAMERALRLAAQVREELGSAWLEASFTRDPKRGLEILATIGSITSIGRGIRSSDTRLQKLQLQHQAVEALLQKAPDKASEWGETLNLCVSEGVYIDIGIAVLS